VCLLPVYSCARDHSLLLPDETGKKEVSIPACRRRPAMPNVQKDPDLPAIRLSAGCCRTVWLRQDPSFPAEE
jgi:hypothetical protein